MPVYRINGHTIQTNTISLADFGDISTSSGFISAFNSVVSDVSISDIIIPFGIYTVSGTLNMRSNLHVHGNGAKINVSGTNNLFVFNGVGHCLVENLIIDMNQTKNSTGGTALYIVDSSDLAFKNLTIDNIGVRGCLAYPSDASDGHYLERIMFDNIKMYGIDEENTNQSEWPCGIIAVNLKNSVISNCFVSGMIRFSLEFKNYSSFCSMINNTVIGGETGIAHGGDRPASETILGENMTYIGNRISGSKYPLYFGRIKHMIVSGNVLNGDSMFIEKCSDCLISNNEINGNDTTDALLSIRNDERVYFNENVYTKSGNAELLQVIGDASTVWVTGYYDNGRIDIHSPTSGTPTLT